MEQKYKARIEANKDQYIQLLNQRVKGEQQDKEPEEFEKNYANPVFKYLGLGYKDSIEHSDIFDHTKLPEPLSITNENIHLNNSQLIPSSTQSKFASMNFNRFQHLYNFTPNGSGAAPETAQPAKELPTLNQIINNPCIFQIREKLMSTQMPELYKAAGHCSKFTSHRQSEQRQPLGEKPHLSKSIVLKPHSERKSPFTLLSFCFCGIVTSYCF